MHNEQVDLMASQIVLSLLLFGVLESMLEPDELNNIIDVNSYEIKRKELESGN